jgi:hypothetical protein
MEKALSNITVLDLTRVLAGPYCTMMLADYGANVIKIEMPGKGDDTRAMGPKKNDYSMYYAYVNRGKKGITLNLKSEEGKKLFLEMVKKADVVVENYRPGVMDKLGVGYDVLKEVNDQIIYAAVSGFGCSNGTGSAFGSSSNGSVTGCCSSNFPASSGAARRSTSPVSIFWLPMTRSISSVRLTLMWSSRARSSAHSSMVMVALIFFVLLS